MEFEDADEVRKWRLEAFMAQGGCCRSIYSGCLMLKSESHELRKSLLNICVNLVSEALQLA